MKSILIFVLLTLSISVFGQHNTYSNLKMSNGDSLKVLIKDVENYKGVYYRFKNSGKTHFLEAHEITSHSSGHRNFISKKSNLLLTNTKNCLDKKFENQDTLQIGTLS
ncbi:MAG: hypothetical protein NXI00_09005 [Cytophagales bacterium]|nr:hypothetical protein [Cytophagales bacterium]